MTARQPRAGPECGGASVSKDTRMTSKRGWAGSARGGAGGEGSGMFCVWSPSGQGLAHAKLPPAGPPAPGILRCPLVVLAPRVELGLPEAWSGPDPSAPGASLPPPVSAHPGSAPGLWPPEQIQDPGCHPPAGSALQFCQLSTERWGWRLGPPAGPQGHQIPPHRRGLPCTLAQSPAL